MVTRKSSDGSRGANGAEQRPGSYVKVTARRRRRGGDARGGTAGERTGVDARGPSVRERDDAARASDPDGLGGSSGQAAREESELADHIDYAVDDLRPSRLSSQRAIRREHGPLGIRDPRPERSSSPEQAPDSAPPEDARPTSPGPAVMRVNVIEVNTTVDTSPPASIGGDELDGAAGALDRVADLPPARPEGEDERTRADAGVDEGEQAHEQERPRARPSGRPSMRARLARASARPSMRAIASQDGDADGDERATLPDGVAAELSSRPSLSSVLGARPSFRPSPMPPPRSKLGWWLMIGLLTSIIGAAAMVAAREHWGEQPEAQTPAASVPTASSFKPLSAAAKVDEAARADAIDPGAATSTQMVAPAAPRVHVEQGPAAAPRPRPRPLVSPRKPNPSRTRVPAVESRAVARERNEGANATPVSGAPASGDATAPSAAAMEPETAPAPASAAAAAAAAALSEARAALSTPNTVVAPPAPASAPAAPSAQPATGSSANAPSGAPAASAAPAAPSAPPTAAAEPVRAAPNTAGHGINPYAD